MNGNKRRYWTISEETTKKISNIQINNYKDLENRKIIYGEVISIAIDLLDKELKNNTLEAIKKDLYQ